MADACFSPSSLALLAIIGGALQAAIIGLFWMGIRAKDDSIRDARELRDRALDVNERAILSGERQADAVTRTIARRGKS